MKTKILNSVFCPINEELTPVFACINVCIFYKKTDATSGHVVCSWNESL